MGIGESLFFVLRPSNALVFLLIVGVLLLPFRRRLGVALMVAATVLMAAVGFLPVGTAALAVLEERFPLVTPDEPIDGIVVLGGYHASFGYVPGGSVEVPLNEHAERLTTAASLAFLYPDAQIILTDGGEPVSGAELSAAFLRSIGIPDDRIVVEPAARSTLQNAIFARDIVHPAPDGRYILITSGWHMPRAVATFRAAGWPEPIPYPVDAPAKSQSLWLSFNASFAEGLDLADVAAREYLATLQYYILGRTGELLASPRTP